MKRIEFDKENPRNKEWKRNKQDQDKDKHNEMDLILLC